MKRGKKLLRKGVLLLLICCAAVFCVTGCGAKESTSEEGTSKESTSQESTSQESTSQESTSQSSNNVGEDTVTTESILEGVVKPEGVQYYNPENLSGDPVAFVFKIYKTSDIVVTLDYPGLDYTGLKMSTDSIYNSSVKFDKYGQRGITLKLSSMDGAFDIDLFYLGDAAFVESGLPCVHEDGDWKIFTRGEEEYLAAVSILQLEKKEYLGIVLNADSLDTAVAQMENYKPIVKAYSCPTGELDKAMDIRENVTDLSDHTVLQDMLMNTLEETGIHLHNSKHISQIESNNVTLSMEIADYKEYINSELQYVELSEIDFDQYTEKHSYGDATIYINQDDSIGKYGYCAIVFEGKDMGYKGDFRLPLVFYDQEPDEDLIYEYICAYLLAE